MAKSRRKGARKGTVCMTLSYIADHSSGSAKQSAKALERYLNCGKVKYTTHDHVLPRSG